MAHKIDTVSARSRLLARREPYWLCISKGRYLGFRKAAADSLGTWVARAADSDSGKQHYQSLGALSEHADHARCDAAKKAAQAWFDHLDRGGSTQSMTVRTACARYVEHLSHTKSSAAAGDAERRLANCVLGFAAIADTELRKLTPTLVEVWRKSLKEAPMKRIGPSRGRLRSDSTLNRDMTCFRAALNLALADGLVTTDFAWRKKLTPVKNADRRRGLYLDREQRRRLIEVADEDVGQFLRGLAMLPLRPGALAALTVRDFDARLRTLRIGKDKHGQDRRLRLPENSADLFIAATEGRPDTDALLRRANGKAWDKDAWKDPIKDAASMAGLPSETTAYTLRHSVITDLVHDGLDLLTVAQISGTSVAMIERHYGHLRSDIAAHALAKLVL